MATYQVNIELLRFDYRGSHDERTVVVSASAKGEELKAIVEEAIGKFVKMLDVEQEEEMRT